MEVVYSIFIGIISSKIVGKIDGIGLQCRRDRKAVCDEHGIDGSGEYCGDNDAYLGASTCFTTWKLL